MNKSDQHIIDKLRASVDEHLTLCRYKEDYAHKKVLEIAPDEHQGAHNTFINAQVTTLNLDDSCDVQADICELLPFKENTFDCIVCFEVLEHTNNPFIAIDQLRRVLRRGGSLYLTTPFMFRIHNPLPDNFRFTEHGLRVLLKDFREVYIERSGRELSPLHYRTIAKK